MQLTVNESCEHKTKLLVKLLKSLHLCQRIQFNALFTFCQASHTHTHTLVGCRIICCYFSTIHDLCCLLFIETNKQINKQQQHRHRTMWLNKSNLREMQVVHHWFGFARIQNIREIWHTWSKYWIKWQPSGVEHSSECGIEGNSGEENQNTER